MRVIVPHVGGGFGGKAGIHIEPLVACLSRKAGGRPVKFAASREEEFSLLPCRSALIYRVKTGVSSDGKIAGQQMTMYWDSGAYADYAVNVTRASGYSAAGPYEIPNAWVDAYTIYTNKPFGTAYRGFGHVEFFWGLERHMDLVAHAIGMDGLEFRKKNALRPGSVTLTGEKIEKHTGNVTACLKAAERAVGYGKLTAEEKKREQKSGMKIGKSVVALHKAPAMPPFTATGVILKMNEDATVTANFSLTEIGQGTYTALAQIIAEALRFPLHRIKISQETDTDRDPYDWQTVASKGLLLTGNAALLAVQDLLHKAYNVAAQILGAGQVDLERGGPGREPDRLFPLCLRDRGRQGDPRRPDQPHRGQPVRAPRERHEDRRGDRLEPHLRLRPPGRARAGQEPRGSGGREPGRPLRAHLRPPGRVRGREVGQLATGRFPCRV